MKLSLGVGFFSFVLFCFFFFSIIFALVPAEGTYECEATTSKMMKLRHFCQKNNFPSVCLRGKKYFKENSCFPFSYKFKIVIVILEYAWTWYPFNFNNRFNYYNNIVVGTDYFTLFGVQLDFTCLLCRGTSWHSGSFLWRYRIKTDNSGLFPVREFKDTSPLVQQYWFIHQKVFDIQANLPWEVKTKFNPKKRKM